MRTNIGALPVADFRKYKLLALIYLISVIASSIANSIGGNVQSFYRIPFIDIRWIDLSILLIAFTFFYQFNSKIRKIKGTDFLVSLCFIYLIFESFQLYKSWGLHDRTSQLSHFLCTLSLFIVIDLSTYRVPTKEIIKFLTQFSLVGAVVLTISNFYLIYAFLSGNVVFEDLDIRVALEVVGSKETVYSSVLLPLVYSFGLYTLQRPAKMWVKLLYIACILSIYASLAVTFHRGTLVIIAAITCYFIFSSGKFTQLAIKLLGLFAMMAICYFLIGGVLGKKGYDPIEKIVETAKFSVDVDNPDWDKGRHISREYAINAWEKNIWLGAGYDELINYGLPETIATAHNGVITSLFHRGVVGTTLLMIILTALFINAGKLWFLLSRQKNEENRVLKLLVLSSFFWLIAFMTQEALWEKYSLCIQYLYLGLITNIYKSKIDDMRPAPKAFARTYPQHNEFV